jgi:acyl-CoA dehydrogenase
MNSPLTESLASSERAALVQATSQPAWRSAAQRVAQIAAQHAGSVDREARFPAEAIAALKAERLLAATVPTRLGGEGLSLTDVAAICEMLGRACSSTAMIYAMHLSQLACIIEHGGDVPLHQATLAQFVKHQWLLASATSEENIGGSMRTSACAVEIQDGRFRVAKSAPTISYGAHADAILVTARRTADSPASDQVLVIALTRDLVTLEKRGSWDSLGMRGTCSEGFRLVAEGPAEQVLHVSFEIIANETMLPVSHALWASVWTGISGDAVNRAHAFFLAQARAKPGSTPPSGARLAEAVSVQQMMQTRVQAALEIVEAAQRARLLRRLEDDEDTPLSATLSLATQMNTLKTSISTTALQVVDEAMMICGMAGYKNDTPFSLGRHLRDLHSARLMINNDRIAQNIANLLLAQRPSIGGKS